PIALAAETARVRPARPDGGRCQKRQQDLLVSPPVALALAAYNAGPAPVEACNCVPAIPETTAYVGRILALLGGAGAIATPSFEVRLVA
ncbi:MAG TPA: hypothetical protein VMR96_11245, partial [Solirubrobacterales bacterium]|nr:hypothetical protein [Solirubrobacterales bacterium]